MRGVLLPNLRTSNRLARLAVELELDVPDPLRVTNSPPPVEEFRLAVKVQAGISGKRLAELPSGQLYTASMPAGLPSDALLASFLPAEDRADIVRHLITIASDRLHLISTRHETLAALEVLSRRELGDELGSILLQELHALGLRLALSDDSRSPHELETHPLSAFRINWGPVSLIGQGIRLAYAAARNEEEREAVSRTIGSLPLRSLESVQANAVANVAAAFGSGDGVNGHSLQSLGRLGSESLRAAAAIWWTNSIALASDATEEEADLGVELARDESALVRRSFSLALASAVARGSELNEAAQAVAASLRDDRYWSVRKSLV
jgi:hypothetical protein